MPSDAAVQMQYRCAECGRRLFDYVNRVAQGQAIVEVKCPKCGEESRLTLGQR